VDTTELVEYGSLEKVQGHRATQSHRARVDMSPPTCGPVGHAYRYLVDLCDMQHAGKEIVKRPTFKSLQMTLCHCVACRHLTWKLHHACSLGTQVFYILD